MLKTAKNSLFCLDSDHAKDSAGVCRVVGATQSGPLSVVCCGGTCFRTAGDRILK